MLEGASIGPYRVLRKLGEGGMGIVYLGEHTLLGRRAAIKVLPPELSSKRESVDRFFVEARATTAITDPGIVQVYDFGFTQDTAYIVMELLEGEQLHVRIARLGALAPSDALRITRQIAASLQAAHAAGIVHRDLKPENLFMVRDPESPGQERVKIVDFGIAKLSDELPDRMRTRTGAVLGTPVYMSPEQCDGAAKIDHRSDIYSLGCVLFHLVTGRPPFDHDGIGAIISAHLREAPPLPSSIRSLPPGLDELVIRCLAKAPRDRFGSMAEVQHACDALLGQGLGPISHDAAASSQAIAVTASLPPVPARPLRLGRWIAASALAGGLGAAAAVLVARHEPAAPAAQMARAPAPAAAVAPVAPAALATVAHDAGVDAAVDADTPDAGSAVAPVVAPRPRPAVKPPQRRPSTDDLYDDRN